MGALCGSPSSRRDAEIDDYQHKQFKAENQVIRTLLLGTGATGKSTLFQSFQLAKEGAIPIQDRLKMRHTIRCNIIYGMYTLIEQSEKLYAIDPMKFENCQLFPNNNNSDNNNNNEEYSKELREKIDFIRRFYIDLTYITDESAINFDEFGDAATIVLYLWNLDSIQNTFKNRCKYFAFDDNLPYFFENVESIMNSDYVPSEEHVLKNRARSTGLARYEYILQTNAPSVSHNQIKVEVLDVGGQRNERRKWIHYFEDISGVIFVASLIDHNGVLFEASNMNALKESLNLFNKITALKWFQKSEIILFLNKDDLLRKLLQTKDNGLSICFNNDNNNNTTGGANNDNNFFEWNENEIWDSSIDSQYYDNNTGLFLHDNNDNDNDDNNNEMKMMEGVETSNKFEEYHDKVVTFMANLFLTRNKSANQKLTVHVTTALHNIAVHKVFETVHKSIVLNNLKRVGIYQNKSKLNNNNNNINIGNSQGFNNKVENNNNNGNNIVANDISRNDNVMTGSKSNHSSTSIGAIISSSSPSNHDTNSMMIITDHTSNSNNGRNRNDRADTLSVNETNTNGNSGNIYGDIDNEIENDTGVDSGIDNDNNDNNNNDNNSNKMDKPNSLKAQLRVASTSRGSIDESNTTITNTNTNNEMLTMQTHLDLNVIDNNNE